MSTTKFDQCSKEFGKLSAPVNDDPLAQTTIADLVAATQFELDLQDEGEQEPLLTGKQIRQLRRFVTKWKT
jgi:hypothetical protein